MDVLYVVDNHPHASCRGRQGAVFSIRMVFWSIIARRLLSQS